MKKSYSDEADEAADGDQHAVRRLGRQGGDGQKGRAAESAGEPACAFPAAAVG